MDSPEVKVLAVLSLISEVTHHFLPSHGAASLRLSCLLLACTFPIFGVTHPLARGCVMGRAPRFVLPFVLLVIGITPAPPGALPWVIFGVQLPFNLEGQERKINHLSEIPLSVP